MAIQIKNKGQLTQVLQASYYLALVIVLPISVQWWVTVAAHCWFNAGQLGMTLSQHHSNTDDGMILLHQRLQQSLDG